MQVVPTGTIHDHGLEEYGDSQGSEMPIRLLNPSRSVTDMQSQEWMCPLRTLYMQSQEWMCPLRTWHTLMAQKS
jgi:hypothetical protein